MNGLPAHQERHGLFVFLPLSLIGAFFAAVVFVIAMTVSLPPTDGAYETNPFADPLVLVVLLFFALPAGLLTWPISYFALRDTDLARSVAVVYSVTLSWIVVTTLLVGPEGLILSLIGLPASLWYCWKKERARRAAKSA